MNGAPKTQAAARDGRQQAKIFTGTGTTLDFTCGVLQDKVTNVSLNLKEPTLFDSPEVNAAREMEYFFASIHPHLEGLRPGDRLSVISCLYWLRVGEEKETITALLRKPLRAVFDTIAKEVCHA